MALSINFGRQSVLYILISMFVLMIVVRFIWPDWRHSLRTWFELAVTPVLFPAQVVSTKKLQSRILAKAMASATVTLDGRAVLPQRITVSISNGDFERLQPIQHILVDEIESRVRKDAEKRGWVLPTDLQLEVDSDPDVRDGRPKIDLEYGATGENARTASLEGGRTVLNRTVRKPHDAPVGSRTEPYVFCELIRVDEPGLELPLDDRRVITVGRTAADVLIDHPLVSSVHAELVYSRGHWVLRDCGSLNGTWVNGEQIDEKSLLHNDELSFAHDGPRFVFSRLSPDSPGRRAVR